MVRQTVALGKQFATDVVRLRLELTVRVIDIYDKALAQSSSLTKHRRIHGEEEPCAYDFYRVCIRRFFVGLWLWENDLSPTSNTYECMMIFLLGASVGASFVRCVERTTIITLYVTWVRFIARTRTPASKVIADCRVMMLNT